MLLSDHAAFVCVLCNIYVRPLLEPTPAMKLSRGSPVLTGSKRRLHTREYSIRSGSNLVSSSGLQDSLEPCRPTPATRRWGEARRQKAAQNLIVRRPVQQQV